MTRHQTLELKANSIGEDVYFGPALRDSQKLVDCGTAFIMVFPLDYHICFLQKGSAPMVGPSEFAFAGRWLVDNDERRPIIGFGIRDYGSTRWLTFLSDENETLHILAEELPLLVKIGLATLNLTLWADRAHTIVGTTFDAKQIQGEEVIRRLAGLY